MTSQEIADSIGMRKDNLHSLIEKLVSTELLELPKTQGVKNHIGQTITEFIICTDDARLLVTQSSTKQGILYCKFLIQCEKALRVIANKPVKIPTMLELAKHVVALLEMQEHQIKALETSQRNNASLTLEVKKLRLALQGKNEWMSMSQFTSTMQIKPRKNANRIVFMLKSMPDAKFQNMILGEQRFPTCMFHIDFLEEQFQFILNYFQP